MLKQNFLENYERFFFNLGIDRKLHESELFSKKIALIHIYRTQWLGLCVFKPKQSHETLKILVQKKETDLKS